MTVTSLEPRWRKPTKRVRELWLHGQIMGIVERGSYPGHWWWVVWRRVGPPIWCSSTGCSRKLREARAALMRATGVLP